MYKTYAGCIKEDITIIIDGQRITRGIPMAFIITNRCVKCGACKQECPNKAIVEESKKFAIDPNKCVQCGACICPNKAIDEI